MWFYDVEYLQRHIARNVLESFPYFSNYIALTRLESAVIFANLDTPLKHIAFIGSGPLSLTSLCYAQQLPSVQIHNIDHDGDAIRISSSLACSLECANRLTFSCESATSSTSLENFDVVYLAALVGSSSEEKLAVLQKVVDRMRHGALVCIRSAHSLRGLMYPVSF